MQNTPTTPAAPAAPAMTLDVQVAMAVTDGWMVESQTPTQAILVKSRKCNHILHLLLSVFTGGLWLPVWIVQGVRAGTERRVISAPVSASPTPGTSAWRRTPS